MPLFNRRRAAKTLSVSGPRITQMTQAGDLPEPITDDETEERGWTAATIYQLAAQRTGKQASPALASMPEATTPAPVVARKIVQYAHLHDHRTRSLPETSQSALATHYETPHGPVVLIQPLGTGRTLPRHDDVHVAPPTTSTAWIQSRQERVSVTVEATQALGVPPFETRWLLHSDGSIGETEIRELIIETIPDHEQHNFEPWLATAHTIPQAVVQSRLGRPPEIVPGWARTLEAVEQWAASDFNEDHVIVVDVGDHVRRADLASVLHGLHDSPVPSLAAALEQSVTRREAITPLPVGDYRDLGLIPEHSVPVPRLAFPPTPSITSSQRTPESFEREALIAEMKTAQELLDFYYVPGRYPDPRVALALREGIYAGANAIRVEMGDDPRLPHSSYFVRFVPGSMLDAFSDDPFRAAASRESDKRWDILAASHDLIDQQRDITYGYIAGYPAIKGAEQGEEATLCAVMNPTIGSLAGDPSYWRSWQNIYIHCRTQRSVIWVEYANGWAPLPLQRNALFATGYGGSGPTSTVDAITGFLEWAHERPLSELEASLLSYRITQDKAPWVRIDHDSLPSLT